MTRHILSKIYRQRGYRGKEFKNHFQDIISEHISDINKKERRVRVKPIIQAIKRLNIKKNGGPYNGYKSNKIIIT